MPDVADGILQVFKAIEKELPQLTTLDLQYVSPSLLEAHNFELAVPGKFNNDMIYFYHQ